MALVSYGVQLLRELLPAARRGIVRDAEDAAAKRGGTVIARDVAQIDAELLQGVARRDAVKVIAELDAGLRRANPGALARKYENMAKSPRRFLTGQPALMASDMKQLPAQMGAETVLQGDMHLHNFGTVVKANGKLKVRPIDFDEATIGPALFDVNRFATHVVLTGREHDFGAKRTRALIETLGGSYYDTLAGLAQGKAVKGEAPAALKQLVKEAEERDAAAWITRRAPKLDGLRRLERDADRTDVTGRQLKELQQAFERYRAGLSKPGQQALAGYQVSDAVAVVSGTGSVGRPRFRVLLEAERGGEPIILQWKGQQAAALERVLPEGRRFAAPGRRGLAIGDVFDGGLDPLRGAAKGPQGFEYLIERVRASDATLHVDEIEDRKALAQVVAFYANQAAKGHARGAEVGLAGAKEILATLGPREGFIDALVAFAHDYADRVERDHAAFTRALKRDPLLARVGKG